MNGMTDDGLSAIWSMDRNEIYNKCRLIKMFIVLLKH